MADEVEKPPLVEDRNFLASLDDLDRGLEYEGQPFIERRRRPRPPRPVAPPISPPPAIDRAAVQPPPRPQPPTATAALSPPPSSFAAPAQTPMQAAPGRRPLLDLFPPTPADNERPPGPLAGTAVGPRMASDTTRRRLTPPPSAPVAPPSESYETFYGLREKPFGVSTDPKFFFPSVGHERLVVDMLTAVAERQPVMLITGQPGIGKTTVCRAVLPQLDRRTMSSLVSEPATSIDDLLKTVLIDFGVVSHDDLARGQHVARDSLAATLDSFLDSLAPLQASAVVVVDDAERQPAGVLAALSRFAGGTSASLQIVLVGTGALSARLKEDPGLRALDAAIAVRAELGPLAGDEIAGYVMHRIAVAGTNPRVEFSDAAIARLFELSRGVPGVVNLLCDRAMMHGYEQSAATIDAALVDAAAAEAGALDGSTFGRPPIALIAMTAGVLLVLALAGGAAALWVFRDAVARTVVQWEKLPEPPGGPVLLNPVPLEPIPPP